MDKTMPIKAFLSFRKSQRKDV